MADTKVADKKQSVAERAVSVRPNFEGPHRNLRKKGQQPKEEPAYVIAVTKRDADAPPEKPRTYNPEEARAKAKSLLSHGKLSPQERSVLEEILGPDKEAK